MFLAKQKYRSNTRTLDQRRFISRRRPLRTATTGHCGDEEVCITQADDPHIRFSDDDAVRTQARHGHDGGRSIGPRGEQRPTQTQGDHGQSGAGHNPSPKAKNTPAMPDLPVLASCHLQPSEWRGSHRRSNLTTDVTGRSLQVLNYATCPPCSLTFSSMKRFPSSPSGATGNIKYVCES